MGFRTNLFRAIDEEFVHLGARALRFVVALEPFSTCLMSSCFILEIFMFDFSDLSIDGLACIFHFFGFTLQCWCFIIQFSVMMGFFYSSVFSIDVFGLRAER